MLDTDQLYEVVHVSAFEEMSSKGHLGRETFELFVFHVASIAWRYGYPSPRGLPRWTREDCVEWVLDFFDKKKAEVASKLFYQATDERSFTALARKAIENELKDQARATTVGKLRSRMRTLLPKVADFKDATALYAKTAAWTLDGLGDAIYQGDWMDLLSAPDLKQIDPIRALNSAGPTSAENAAKLIQAARILLVKASGAMRDQDLAAALVKLFELEEPDAFLGREQDGGELDSGRPLSPEEHVEATEFADQLIFELSIDEGRALLVLDQPLAVARELLPHVHDLKSFLEGVRVKLALLLHGDLPPRGGLDLVPGWFQTLP